MPRPYNNLHPKIAARSAAGCVPTQSVGTRIGSPPCDPTRDARAELFAVPRARAADGVDFLGAAADEFRVGDGAQVDLHVEGGALARGMEHHRAHPRIAH